MPRRFTASLIGCVFTLTTSTAAIASAFGTREFRLADYPVSQQIVVGTLSVELIPNRSFRLKAPTSGELHLRTLPRHSRELIPSGTLWGEFDPERLKLEREALTLARTLLEKKQQPKAALDLAREAGDLVERRSELTRQADMLKRIQEEPELARLYAGDGRQTDDALRTEIAGILKRLETQTALIDEVIAFVGGEEDQRIEARVLELKMIQQETDLQQRESERRLTMPFDGELTLIPRLPPDGRPLRVQSGEDLALIQDFSIIQARLIMKRADWRLIPPEQLHLRIATGLHPLTAHYSHGRLEEVNARTELVNYFVFSEKDRGSARALVGGGLNARLVAQLPEPASIVPKLDLILRFPAAFRQGDWRQGLSQALPDSRLLAIGETQLALIAIHR